MRNFLLTALQIFFITAFLTVVSASGATRTVTKTEDTNDGACDADCSLREAIAAAAGGDTVEFASPLFDTAQIITLSDAVGFQQLSINKNLIINGRAANLLTVRRAAAVSAPFRIFSISLTPSVTLKGMTITGGSNGGGGGGIFIDNTATLTVNNCHITDNRADFDGGGIRNVNGTVNINNSTVSGNTAIVTGGGGIASTGGTINLTNSTVSGNVSSGAAAVAGGVLTTGGAVNLINSTVTNNLAGGVERQNSAIVRVSNSIVAANQNNQNKPDVVGAFVSNGYNLIGNVGAATGFTNTGDQTGNGTTPLDPRLGALALNGGATPTHNFASPASPAIDKGSSFGQATDQRGSIRPFDLASVANQADGADIGAFEQQFDPTAAAVSISGRALTPAGRGLRNARVTLTDAGGRTQTTLTSAFGYYRFSEVAAGQTVIVQIVSKRYSFEPQIINVTENIEDLNFAALAPPNPGTEER